MENAVALKEELMRVAFLPLFSRIFLFLPEFLKNKGSRYYLTAICDLPFSRIE